MAIQDTDPRVAGVEGLNFLQGTLDPAQRKPTKEEIDEYFKLTRATGRKSVNEQFAPTSAEENIGLELGTEFGKSVYDKDINSVADAQNLNEVRAQHQSTAAKWGAGITKMLGTAGTTFLDNTVGLLYGVGTGIANVASDDPNKNAKGFWRGVWDNDFTNAMADLQEQMEKALPNYRSQWEQEASLWQRMGTANFWADTVVKNMGFTLGAAASAMLIPGSASTTFGKIALGATRLTVASAGEASIEALNSVRDNRKMMDAQLQERYMQSAKALQQECLGMLSNGADERYVEFYYNDQMSRLDQETQAYREQAEQEYTNAGNAVFAANMAVLMASNYLTLGSLIKGGAVNGKTLENAIKFTSGDTQISGIDDIAKAMYNNTLGITTDIPKSLVGKTLGRTAATGFREGFVEEGTQGLISTASQLHTQAKMNEFARKNRLPVTTAQSILRYAEPQMKELQEEMQRMADKGIDLKLIEDYYAERSAKIEENAKKYAEVLNKNSMLGAMINPDASEELIDWGKAVGEAWQQDFVNSDRGWEEVMAGVITGVLGVPGAHRNASNKLTFGWNGGFVGAYQELQSEYAQQKAYADAMDKALQSAAFRQHAQHAVENLTIRNIQETASANDDVTTYKNAEVMQIVGDIANATNLGILDSYVQMYDEFAKGVSDKDVEQLRMATTGTESGKSALDGMTDEDIKKLYQEKAQRTKEKIKEVINTYNAVQDEYRDKFSPEVAPYAIQELTYLNSLLDDTNRRISLIEDKEESLILTLEKEKRTSTPQEQSESASRKQALNELNKQALDLRKRLDEYKENPGMLAKDIEKQIEVSIKRELYKQGEKALSAYKDAKTLKDVVDIYLNSPQEDREAVLVQAIEQADGDTKTLLESFQDYTSDVSAMETMIDEAFAPQESDSELESARKAQSKETLRSYLNDVVQEMLTDESPVATRADLLKRMSSLRDTFQVQMSELEESASYIKRGEHGELLWAKEVPVSESEAFDDGKGNVGIRPNASAEEKHVRDFLRLEQLQEALDLVNRFSTDLDNVRKLRSSGQKKGQAPSKPQQPAKPAGKKSAGKKTAKSITALPMQEGLKRCFALNTTKSKFVVGLSYTGVQLKKGISKEEAQKDTDAVKLREVLLSQIDTLKARIDILPHTAPDEIKKALNSFIDYARNNITTSEAQTLLEDAFERYKEYLDTPTGKKSQPGPSPIQGQTGQSISVNTDMSLEGTQFEGYIIDENRCAVKYVYSNKVLDRYALGMQQFVDTMLHSIVAANPDISVHYLKPNTQAQSTVIYLGFNTKDIPKTTVLPNNAAIVEAVDEEGKQGKFVLFGTLGFNKDYNGAVAADSHRAIDDYIDSAREGSSADWFVSTKYTNKVKAQNEGELVTRFEEEKAGEKDLQEVLDGAHNPRGLKIGDLAWGVVEGTEDDPTMKLIGTKGKTTHMVTSPRPGQLYMYIPNANGTYTPVFMNSVFYEEFVNRKVSNTDQNPLEEQITKRVEILADPNTSVEEKKKAIGELRDYLVFSNSMKLSYNDDTADFEKNTIRMSVGGVYQTVVDLNKDTDPSANKEAILQALKKINPRINIKVSILENPLGGGAEFYLKSGVLRTDIASMGTINSKFFVYPVQTIGEPEAVFNKKKTPSTDRSRSKRNSKEREYLDGKYYYRDGTRFYDSSGNALSKEEEARVRILFDVAKGKYEPIFLNKAAYYVVGDNVYMSNGHGGLETVDSTVADNVKKQQERNSKKQTRTNNLKSARVVKKSATDQKTPTKPTEQTEEQKLSREKEKEGTSRRATNVLSSDSIDDAKKAVDNGANQGEIATFAEKLGTFYTSEASNAQADQIDSLLERFGDFSNLANQMAARGMDISNTDNLSEKTDDIFSNLNNCHK